jgi:hypothetical protein
MAVNAVAAGADVPAPILDMDVSPGPARTSGRRSFIEILGEAARPPPATGPPHPASATRPIAGPAPSPVRAMAQGALDAEREIDAVLAAAASGRTFSSTELLALQVKVFRYSQAVEVISRTADRVVGALKQALGTQV